MKFLLFLFLCRFFSMEIPAYSYFHFNPEKINLTNNQFLRWVRPQTRKIVHEFYAILKRIDSIHGDLIKIKNDILKLHIEWKKWEKECAVFQADCRERLKEYYRVVRHVDIAILKLQKNLFKIKRSNPPEKIDARISLALQLDQLANLNYQMIHLFEKLLITENTVYYVSLTSENLHQKLLYKALIISELTITGQLNKKIKDDFDFLWSNFIKDLERFVYLESRKNFLVERLENLNIAWNSFNMRVSKGRDKLPNNTDSIVKTMHSRWNSILKIVLNY